MQWINKLIKRKVRFILISTQRSGTTLLSEYLSSHNDIYMGRELFKVSGEGRNVDENSYRSFNGSVEEFLDTFYAKKSKGVNACGFKLMADQIEQFPEIEVYIKKNNILCIYLERRNILDTAVSRLLARIRKVYHSDEERCFKAETLDIDNLKNELDIVAKTNKELRHFISPLESMTIYYENLVHTKEESIEEVLGFLKVPNNCILKSNLKKINSNDLSQMTDNYDDIVRMLISTKYISYLNEGTIYQTFNDTYKTIFVHIPKVAGSSIEKALFHTYGEVGHHYALEYVKDDPIRFDQYFTFAFVRNPLDRFVSAYEYLRQGGRNKYDAQWAKEHILDCENFREFVLKLEKDHISKEILSWMHFKPQYLYTCDKDDNILVDFVGKYESLNDDFAYVAEKLSLKLTLPHENKTEQRGDYLSYFDEETLQIMYKIYHRDFKLFNYHV